MQASVYGSSHTHPPMTHANLQAMGVATPTNVSGDSRQGAIKAHEVVRKKNGSERLEAVVPNLSLGTTL